MSIITDINIAYIGGGSRDWARKLMSDLAFEPRISGQVALYDIDKKAAKQNEKLGNLISNRPEAKSHWEYVAVDTLDEALENADFVIISILPGTFQEMNIDVHLPEKYGIYQSVGDTVGFGGHMRALRAIPMMVEFAEKIREIAPDAWVINYTNPMSICTRTLYRVFPEIKAIGYCHEVFGTQNLLAHMVRDMLGIEKPERHEIKVNILGINHFTWINHANYQEVDLFPLYEQFAERYYESGYEESKDEWKKSVFGSCNRVKFDLFQQYGWIAAAGDRHLAEFVPEVYLKDPETVEEWKFRLTPVSWRIADRREKVKQIQQIVNGEEKVELVSSGEEGIGIILGLLGLHDFVTNVNLPNKGQIANLPHDVIVETNAFIQKDRIQPIYAGELPLDIKNVITTHVNNQEAIVTGMLTENKRLLFNAFRNEPVAKYLTKDEVRQLYTEMLAKTSSYLPDWLL